MHPRSRAEIEIETSLNPKKNRKSRGAHLRQTCRPVNLTETETAQQRVGATLKQTRGRNHQLTVWFVRLSATFATATVSSATLVMASVHERERALIADEIRHVVAALRRNRTPEQGDSSDGSEDQRSESFRLLRRKLYTWGEISAVPPLDFLSPFLLVCQCESASGPITGAALDSIYSLLSSGLLQPETPGATDAIRTVADAVSHCRFEATDPAHDDTVLARITSVLLAALRCPIGNLLSDDHVCAMVYATFHIGHHTGRESTLLVHSSRATLVELVRTVFSSAALSQKSTASDVASVHVDAEADAVLAPCWGAHSSAFPFCERLFVPHSFRTRHLTCHFLLSPSPPPRTSHSQEFPLPATFFLSSCL